MLFAEATEQFLTYLSALGRAERTILAYKERLKRLQNQWDKKTIEEVRAYDLDVYVANLRKSLSPVSVADHIQAAKTFFRWCVQRGYLIDSPAAHLRKPKIEQSARNKAIRDDDFWAMLNVAKSENRTMEIAILMFLLDTGCRAGELCALNLCQIDLEKHEAQVVGKTGERILDFTEPTAQAVSDWLNERKAKSDNDPIFVDNKGERITVNVLNSRLRGLARRAKVKGRYNPHSFRHRVGQGWIDQGANLEIVRLKLGHRDIHTTSVFYANQDRERQKKASEKYSLVK